MMRFVFLAFLAVAMSACESEPPMPAVVVYASDGEGSELEKSFAAFYAETNIPITSIWGNSTTNTDNLISNAADIADVLITNNVADIWRAADEGVLRPINSAVLDDIDLRLRDSDRYWAAIEVRSHAIVTTNNASREQADSYSDLAKSEMQGRVCLSSSSLHTNRSLIALLINDRGKKKAERLVRGWIRNLAAPPFRSEDELIAAIREGTCEFGIASWRPNSDALAFFLPEQGYLDVAAIGVARHARQSDSAQRFVEWMLDREQSLVSSERKLSSVGVAGWYDEDAKLLAVRAGYH